MAKELLDQLSAEMKTHADVMTSLTDAIGKPDCSADDLAKFDEAQAKFQEAQVKHKEAEANYIGAQAREDRVRAAKLAAEYQVKFDDDTLRSPSYTRKIAKVSERQRKDPAAFNRAGNMAFAAWTLGGNPADIPAELVEACKELGVNPAATRFEPGQFISREMADATIMRALSANGGRAHYEGAGFDAAYPSTYADSRDDTTLGLTNQAPTFLAQIANNMVTYGGIMKAPISVETVQDFEDITETYVSDQNTGRQIGEAQTIGTNINPTDGNIVWKAFDYTSDDIIVTERQLERSRAGLPSWIGDALGERLGRRLSIEFTNGLGATNPHGIVKAAIAGGKNYATVATTPAIGYDDVHAGIIWTIDEAFRDGPGVGWMMSETIMIYLQTIKDLEGRPLLNWGWEGQGKRLTLEGYPVYINRQMITTHAQGQNPILFGDFSKYKVYFRKSAVPTLIRDDTTGRRQQKVYFTSLITCDARLRDYGNCPIAYMTVS